MTGLFAALALSAQTAPRVPDQAFYDRLSRWREQFEKVLKNVPSGPIGYGYVTAETLGGAHGEALYPIGSASERYLVFFEEQNAGGDLLYQKRSGQVAVQLWDIPLVPFRGHGQAHGTVLKFLRSEGLELSPKAHLTAAMRKQLSATASFARYAHHELSGGFNDVLRPDGTLTEVENSSDRFPITNAEKKLLQGHRKG